MWRLCRETQNRKWCHFSFHIAFAVVHVCMGLADKNIRDKSGTQYIYKCILIVSFYCCCSLFYQAQAYRHSGVARMLPLIHSFLRCPSSLQTVSFNFIKLDKFYASV